MQGKLSLEIVTPEKLLVKEEVDSVTFPGALGELGILPGHTYLLTTLGIGRAFYQIGSEKRFLSIIGGAAEVGDDKVSILADIAETEEEIDLQRASAAKDRAEARMAGKTDEDVDFERASTALQRALIRIQVASKGRH